MPERMEAASNAWKILVRGVPGVVIRIVTTVRGLTSVTSSENAWICPSSQSVAICGHYSVSSPIVHLIHTNIEHIDTSYLYLYVIQLNFFVKYLFYAPHL